MLKLAPRAASLHHETHPWVSHARASPGYTVACSKGNNPTAQATAHRGMRCLVLHKGSRDTMSMSLHATLQGTGKRLRTGKHAARVRVIWTSTSASRPSVSGPLGKSLFARW